MIVVLKQNSDKERVERLMQHFTDMGLRINIHGILLHQLACCLEISLALDSLDLCKEFSEEMTELPVIIHLHISAGGYDISLSILQGILGRSIAYFFVRKKDDPVYR